MIGNNVFDTIFQKAKTYKYSSMNYIDFDDCKNAEILCERSDLILLKDNSKTPSMLYFAANDFESFVKIVTDLSSSLRLHFVPRQYVPLLEKIGFIEWGEYTDFWNISLTNTFTRFDNISEIEYLGTEECEEAAAVSQKCKLQSRGFEGETKEWFEEWLVKNEVIILRNNSKIAGFCCVSIYNDGTTLWIRELAVDPIYQGTGLGKKLIEQAIRYGVENGAVKGFLAADILNKNAIGLYKKYDFHAKNIEDSEIQMIKM
jgi:ribosomal protein S18 acetylase RimI-like enzyme